MKKIIATLALTISTLSCLSQNGIAEQIYDSNDSLISDKSYDFTQVKMEIDTSSCVLVWSWRNHSTAPFQELHYAILSYKTELTENNENYILINCKSLLDCSNATFSIRTSINQYEYRPEVNHVMGETYYVTSGDGIRIVFEEM